MTLEYKFKGSSVPLPKIGDVYDRGAHRFIVLGIDSHGCYAARLEGGELTHISHLNMGEVYGLKLVGRLKEMPTFVIEEV